jgi:pantetheine-phosphate adenylyltransferase
MKLKIKPMGSKSMIRKAIYAGSFNPWHQGHEDILKKILMVFDKAIVACGINPDKESEPAVVSGLGRATWVSPIVPPWKHNDPRLECFAFVDLLVDVINDYNKNHPEEPITAIARGLRFGYDLHYEQNMQYWNEDLGLTIPVVYFISDRSLAHVSSSAIRQIEKIRSKSLT